MFLLALAAVEAGSAHGVETPWIMYKDPMLPKAPIERGFPDELVDRWLQAVARPEREMQRRAAFAITQAASKGVPGLDATVEPLRKLLHESDDRVVQLTVARALAALESTQSVDLLSEKAGPLDLEMAEIVEPALARWKHAGFRERWIDRLGGEVGLGRFHTLAIRGLAALGEKESCPRMLEIALGREVPTAVRLEAADALGVLQESGLLDTARKLAGNPAPDGVVDRLVAVRMIAGHHGEDTERFLIELTRDPEPSVGAIALGHLFRLDPALILPIVDELVESSDPTIRLWAAKTLVAKPTAELMMVLASMLDDRAPQIRRFVCDSLVELAKDAAMHATIVDQGRQVLNAEGWRGQEQAILLLVTLDDKAIVDRLIALLEAERAEVNVTAAWGLCELAVPSTAEPVFQILDAKTQRLLAGGRQPDGFGDQLALLCQLAGVLEYAPADPVLRKYIPRGTPANEVTRAAGIWALGKLYAEKPDEELTRLLVGRVMDAFAEDPEYFLVCRMSAVSLGRMKAQAAMPFLREAASGIPASIGFGYACRWAIWQLGGEEIPPLKPFVEQDMDWFLTPAVAP